MKTYLGDSVYADYDGYTHSFILTTENGYPTDPSNRIVLEPEVVTTLLIYIERLRKRETDEY